MTNQLPHKPAAKSVRQTIGAAIERGRALSKDERPLSQQEIVRDIIAKLDMPAALRSQLRQRHGLKK